MKDKLLMLIDVLTEDQIDIILAYLSETEQT